MGEARCDSKYICDRSVFRKGFQNQKQPHCTNATNILLTICLATKANLICFPFGEDTFLSKKQTNKKRQLYMRFDKILSTRIF